MRYGVIKSLYLTSSSIALNQTRSQNVQFVARLHDDPVWVWTLTSVCYKSEKRQTTSRLFYSAVSTADVLHVGFEHYNVK
jgi:hypothetical protein